ncbi:MAG: 23S rRNA (uracil(1939)-C(5))-methyltransferase RlmD [Lachnospiraceae bacterium]|jgi:23S rRNA (uracil1939-C5)-methyltransferase|nr:23S rRNA (uracil(1939)-C(5))-methyltransferase RlmD [Lachnospiraceae bacterium]
MKKGQVYEGVVERIDFPNKGIVKVGEDVCVVKNALPGQKVTFSISKLRKGKAEGRLLQVTEQSPLECGSPCSHFGLCGGCTYLSFPYEEQLKIKEGQVKRLLDSVLLDGQGAYHWEGIKASPAYFAYRNKMEFSFGDETKDGPLTLGMHKRGSFYDVLTVNDCRIVDEDYRKILTAVRDYFAERNVCFYHRLSHEGFLRHLLVRKAVKTGEILVALVTTTQSPWKAETASGLQELIDGFCTLLQGLSLDGTLTGVLHMENDSIADVVQSDKTRILYGKDYFYEELLGLKFRITPFSFFQTNSLGAEVLYETARSYIGKLSGGKESVVFDLYSGTGTIAQLMAPVAGKVIGVEIVEEAVEAAKENAALNGLTNCEFLAGDVLKVLDDITEKPDFIILDPPRDGIHPKALPKIINYGVERIVYISCKPTSLVRDLAVFLENGYRVEKATAVDQFPWTANVETICLLSKLNAKQHIEINLDMDELDLTDAEKKATYQEIKDYVLEHSGLKVSSLYIAQVKQKCGIIERENYNKPKSEDAKQPQCPPDKEKAIKEALTHFGMI